MQGRTKGEGKEAREREVITIRFGIESLSKARAAWGRGDHIFLTDRGKEAKNLFAGSGI